MRRGEAKACPDAIADSGVDRRCDFDFIDGEPARFLDRIHDLPLTTEKAWEKLLRGADVQRLNILRSFHAKARRRFHRPDENTSPKIEPVRCRCQQVFAFGS